MGFLKKGIKDARDSLKAMPDLVQQAQAMQQNAQMQAQIAQQQAAAAQAQAVAAATAGAGAPAEAIAGVDLRTFAEVCKGLQAFNYDQSKAVGIAASRGITEADWQTAMDGWNARIQAEPAVAQQFSALYHAGA